MSPYLETSFKNRYYQPTATCRYMPSPPLQPPSCPLGCTRHEPGAFWFIPFPRHLLNLSGRNPAHLSGHLASVTTSVAIVWVCGVFLRAPNDQCYITQSEGCESVSWGEREKMGEGGWLPSVDSNDGHNFGIPDVPHHRWELAATLEVRT